MADEKPKQQSGSDHFLIWGVGIVVCCALSNRVLRWLRIWVRDGDHQVLVAGAIGCVVMVVLFWAIEKRRIHLERKAKDEAVLGPDTEAVFCGHTDHHQVVFIKPKQRAMHTQVIGTTNAGKTESVILPWAIQDIEQGRGLLLIDGKADRSLLNKLWAYTIKAGRKKDFRFFSLSHLEESQTFNPLLGGTSEEITERVFNAFEFENAHYRNVQFEIFSQIMRVFGAADILPTFLRLHQAITFPNALVALARDLPDLGLKRWAESYRDLPTSERIQRTSGLTAMLSHFAFGKTAPLFGAEKSEISLEDALSKNRIVYFQLPVLLSPFLGRATGKMVLQCLQSAIANRHRSKGKAPSFFSVFLDDFSEYLYPGFVSILNKSRSANVGIVFAHQALGDIKALGDATTNAILTNSNIKVFMRGNDPDSAEYFSKVIGTEKATKFTERTKRGLLNEQATGDASAREVDEFIIHPNRFKRELGVGEAVMVVPHDAGSKVVQIKFQKYDDLRAPKIKPVSKVAAAGLATLETDSKKETA